MASEQHVQIRKRFDKFIEQAKNNARHEAALSVDLRTLEQQTPEQQVDRLIRQMQLLNGEIEAFDTVEYFCFAGNEALIYKIFYSRLLCNDKNEEQNIGQGLIFFEKYNLLDKLLIKARKQLSPYTYQDFLNNKVNEMHGDPEGKPFNMSGKDYLHIKEWQTNKMAEVVYCGFELLKENILSWVENKKNYLELLKVELGNIENISRNVTDWTPEQLKAELIQIKGLNNVMLPEQLEVFQQQLCLVIKRDPMNGLIDPSFVDEAMHQISERKICIPVIFYLTMLMVSRWLNDVLKGKQEMKEQGYSRYEELFYHTLNEGHALAKFTNEKLEKKFHQLAENEDQYKDALIQEYHHQYWIYRHLDHPQYFDFIDDEKRLKNAFINDCLYSINCELHIEALKKTIVLNETIEFLDETISLAYHNPLAPLCYAPFDKMHLVEVLCSLTPETIQIKQLMELLTKVTMHCHYDRVPVCFINDELNDSFIHLFKEAVMIYKKHIEVMDPDKRGIFISEQQRDIKYMLRIWKIEHQRISPFCMHVKHILKDESKSTHQMVPYRLLDTSEVRNAENNKEIKPISFGYRTGPRPLKPIMVAMDLEFDLFGEGTTVDDFMEVAMCNDLSKNDIIIHLAAKYNILKALIKRLLPWCPNLKPAIMAQSGIFMMVNEGPLKAKSLYKATPLLLEVEERMDAIFKAKYR